MSNWIVYVHITPSAKYYVGITSQTVNQRWKKGSGYKSSVAFYKAIIKYGWDNIEHEIIAEHLTENESKKFEVLLIKKLKSNNKKHGYNCTDGGDGSLGRKHSDLTKYKISKSNKGRSINGGTSNGMYGKVPITAKRLICVESGEIFESITSASLHIGVHPSSISKPLSKHGICKCKGYTWKELI